MLSLELTRAAGLIVDVLELMGYTTEQAVQVGDLVKRHAVIRQTIAAEEAQSERPSLRLMS